jgi:hypothetical protein
VTTFNSVIVKEPEDKINIEVLRTVANKTIMGRVSYLVDMAKAEALYALGENRAAVELIEGIWKHSRSPSIYRSRVCRLIRIIVHRACDLDP